jgi:hypothetical protein
MASAPAPAHEGSASASHLVAALERSWSALRDRHPEIPEVVLVVASGAGPRRRGGEVGPLRGWPLGIGGPR